MLNISRHNYKITVIKNIISLNFINKHGSCATSPLP
jgi:hypothetical protein